MTPKTLQELYQEHQGKVSDKWLLYLIEYDRLLTGFRHLPVRILEIGVQNGGSLSIWARYFARAEKLVGCDINPECARLTYEDPRIAVVVGDVNLDETERSIIDHAPSFDVIIDDGSHRSSDIVNTFTRYFPRLADGGLFIVEDLHSSYWHEFEGGLFAPHSSTAFFKRLVDIVSHEHWGVQKSRKELLAGFAEHYRVSFEDDALSHIHSIEFINSICVIRKSVPTSNLLGPRVVSGQCALVDSEPKEVSGQHLQRRDQSLNPWSTRSLPLEEELLQHLERLDKLNEKITSLNQAVAERDGEIIALRNSTSWRITQPIRTVMHQARRARGVLRLATSFVSQRGGFRNTLKVAIQLYRREGLAGIKRGFRIVAESGQSRNDYAEWVRRYDSLTDEARATLRSRLDGFPHKPLISVLMPTYNTRPEWLIAAIESVRAQLYPHWELCIADDASTDKAIRPILERYAAQDARIKVVFRSQNGHISAASNSALELVTGEWVALLDHDDLLAEQALFWVADAISRNPEARLIYTDEDKIDDAGRRSGPNFKCDWNLDLFYSHNLISHLGVYYTDLLRAIGGFRTGCEGSQDYDLALRCIERIQPNQIYHVPRVLYHWRMHAQSTAQSNNAKPYAMLAGESVLNEHFQRQRIDAQVERVGIGYRVRYALPVVQPLVSLIIPTRNGLQLIRQCIESILDKTTYSNYEILIVDNGSNDPATLRYLETLQGEARARVRVTRDYRPFNYSALNNAAVPFARGEVLGLLNNDLEVISPEWLAEMVSIALQPGVGAVGARLLYPDDRLQHGGVVLGLGGVAGHSHKFSGRGSVGYSGRATLQQSFSAVTAACLVIRRTVFEAVGGLNEVDLPVAFNDVDFCLRVREAGYRNVWTPYAELYHHESATRGHDDTPEKQARFGKEVAYIKQHWQDLLLNDPAYSPNLTLNDEDFSLAWPPRVELDFLSGASSDRYS